MNNPEKFLSHYGVKGMQWDKRKLEVSEKRINEMTKSKESDIKYKRSDISPIEIAAIAKALLEEKTEYSVEELVKALDVANANVDKDPSLENIFAAGIAQNRLENKDPKAFEEYRKQQFVKFVTAQLDQITKEK